jgi:hypothetical protein
MFSIPAHLRMATVDNPDRRLLLKVTLVATGRPTYQNAFCMNCGKPLCSIEGASVHEVTDVDDDSWEIGKPRLNIRCNGKFCRTFYRFTLN